MAWVVDHPLFADCQEGEQNWGTPCHQWWWEQEMTLITALSYLAVVSDDESTLGTSTCVGGGRDQWWGLTVEYKNLCVL